MMFLNPDRGCDLAPNVAVSATLGMKFLEIIFNRNAVAPYRR